MKGRVLLRMFDKVSISILQDFIDFHNNNCPNNPLKLKFLNCFKCGGELWEEYYETEDDGASLILCKKCWEEHHSSKETQSKYLLYFDDQLIGKYDLEHSTFLEHFAINLNYRNPKTSFTLIESHCAECGKELNLENYKIYDEGYYVCNECFHTKMNSQNAFEL